jgi:ABC-type nitrate/sulfonate/bicarbonate transport system substrate-binding protein
VHSRNPASGDSSSGATLPSILRVAGALAGLIAVTIAFAAWSSASVTHASERASKGSAATKLTGKECKEDRAAGTIHYVTPFGYSASPGVIDVFWAAHQNLFKDLCLNVTINAASFDGSVLVNAGTAQATSGADASLVLGDDGQGQHLIGVETVGQINPESIILNSKYKSLTGLEGQNLGYFQEVDPTVVAMLKAAHVTASKVHFDALTDRNPAIMATGTVAGYVAFTGSQDIQLQAMNVPYTEITASSLGVKGTDNVLYMNQTFIKKYPVAAANFLRAQIKALDYCVAHQGPCINYLTSQAVAAGQGQIDGKAQNTPVWAYQVKMIKQHGTKPLGTFTESTWKAEYQQLKEYGTEANHLSGLDTSVHLPVLAKTMDTKLVASVYNTKGQLVWP